MKQRLGKFEVQAIGYNKSEGSDKKVPIVSIMSRHHTYSQARLHMTHRLGAEKVGIGHNSVFTKGQTQFRIVPVFPEKKKKPKKALKEMTRLEKLYARRDPEGIEESNPFRTVKTLKEVVKRARIRVFEDSEKPQNGKSIVKDEPEIVKGNTTVTGEKADRININPRVPTHPFPKGSKPIVGP